MRAKRWLLAGLLYTGLVGGGILAGHWLTELVEMDLRPSTEPQFHSMLMLATAVYVAASAVPFVPGAEIGMGLMVAFGMQIVFLVYAAMVAALLIAFLAGRFVPASALAGVFGFLGLRRARALVENMHRLSPEERLPFLTARAPARLVPTLLRHRYAAVMVLFNIPGNTLIGGGGGIAMLSGMSGLFSTLYFVVTVAVAVAPLPLLVVLTGYQPMG